MIFLLAVLTTSATLVAAFFGFEFAKLLAFIAAGLIAILVLAPGTGGSRVVFVEDPILEVRTNPATGLPILPDSLVDARGNLFGRNDR
jgi:hypothetical protein